MAVTYKKLWIKLIEREMSKPEFRNFTNISPATMTKLNKNMYVTLEVLERICTKLGCGLDEILDFVPNNETDET